MKEKILNRLLTVKSIVTLTLTAVFAFLSATGAIGADAFQDIFYIMQLPIIALESYQILKQ